MNEHSNENNTGNDHGENPKTDYSGYRRANIIWLGSVKQQY